MHSEPTPTLDDVWRLFRETDRLFKEQAQESERRQQEAERRQQETERFLKEQAQESEHRQQEIERFLKEQAQETDRKFQETRQLLKEQAKEAKETDKRLRGATKKIGELGNRMGEFVEGLIKPSVVSLFQARGIAVELVTRDIEVKRPSLNLAGQIDLLAVNGDSCVVIEVKSRLRAEDIQEHIDRLNKFKLLLPEYKDRRVFGAVAAIVVSDEVMTYDRQGFFVITQKGDMAVILNEENFQPKAW